MHAVGVHSQGRVLDNVSLGELRRALMHTHILKCMTKYVSTVPGEKSGFPFLDHD